ncbi:MAG: hypothetical protein HY000_42425 [Planctomycetes bacterium]|nr:hypothetical protein [Planctomycetota bacterium]
MKGDIDPRLLAQLDQAGDSGEVEALIMLADAQPSGVSEERTTGQRVLERVSQSLRQRPTEVRFMPNLGVMYLKASGRLVRRLLEENEVISASANEAEIKAL